SSASGPPTSKWPIQKGAARNHPSSTKWACLSPRSLTMYGISVPQCRTRLTLQVGGEYIFIRTRHIPQAEAIHLAVSVVERVACSSYVLSAPSPPLPSDTVSLYCFFSSKISTPRPLQAPRPPGWKRSPAPTSASYTSGVIHGQHIGSRHP